MSSGVINRTVKWPGVLLSALLPPLQTLELVELIAGRSIVELQVVAGDPGQACHQKTAIKILQSQMLKKYNTKRYYQFWIMLFTPEELFLFIPDKNCLF